jgi:hypothetical protein
MTIKDLIKIEKLGKIQMYITGLGHRVPTLSFLPLRVVKAGNHLNEESTLTPPPLPLG